MPALSEAPFATEAAACRKAQRAWSVLPIRKRLQPVRELRHRLVECADELFAAVQADVGRPTLEVLATELLPTASALKFQEKEAARVLTARRVPRRLRPTWLFGCRDVVHRRPWGIVGVIGTWNYPLFLNVGPIAAALTAGNGVLWKPSERAPHTAAVTHRLFLEAGFPPHLLTMLPATREGGPLVADAAVDYVLFTGSDGVGRKLAARLGERLIPSTLELSGCDPMFVLADADVKRAAKAAFFGFTLNRGQTCIAVRRIFVHRSRYAEFVEVMSPLVASAGGEMRTHDAESAVRSTKAQGEYHDSEMKPTVLLDCPVDAAICREASFSPICAVIPFDSNDSALSLAAKCAFGLSASVFTADAKTAQEFASHIGSGSVIINDTIAPTAHPATPFGGRGASGWGVTQGPEGLLAMTVSQVITTRHGKFVPHIEEAVNPDPEATSDILHGLLRTSHARGVRTWLGGVRQLVRGVRRRK